MATASRPDPAPRKRSWIGKYKDKDSSSASLPTPQEGRELAYDHPPLCPLRTLPAPPHTPQLLVDCRSSAPILLPRLIRPHPVL